MLWVIQGRARHESNEGRSNTRWAVDAVEAYFKLRSIANALPKVPSVYLPRLLSTASKFNSRTLWDGNTEQERMDKIIGMLQHVVCERDAAMQERHTQLVQASALAMTAMTHGYDRRKRLASALAL